MWLPSQEQNNMKEFANVCKNGMFRFSKLKNTQIQNTQPYDTCKITKLRLLKVQRFAFCFKENKRMGIFFFLKTVLKPLYFGEPKV